MTLKNSVKCKNRNRLIAVVAMAAVLFVMLFSAYYLIKEADHHCTDPSCPVCATIQHCENNLKQIGTVRIAVVAIIAFVGYLCQAITAGHILVSVDTLITQKVRLND